jgi:4'-phosphopantetheinyl transferase
VLTRVGRPVLAAARGLVPDAGAEAGLEVWLLPTDRLSAEAFDLSPLDGEEQRRVERFGRVADRLAFIASRRLLREVLSARLGCPADAITYTRGRCPVCDGPDGRPMLAGAPDQPHFSLSRSDGLALVGVADVPVGVDVQAIPGSEIASDVLRLLHPTERAEIASTPDAAGARFARLWARKEAYLKGIGTGLAHELDGVYVGGETRPGSPAGWTFVDLPMPVGYVAAAAVEFTG